MEFEEGRIIKENPLRILGVFSDTPKKEIVANLGKLRAFAKTGKTLSFDSDFTSLLGPVNRTSNTIEKANNDISLPKDKLQSGMFWFMQHTDNDKAALNCLKSGDVNDAMAIIQKKGNYSGVVNMAVLALILKRWDIALYSYAYLLDSDNRRKALVKAFTDTEDYYSEDDLVDFLSDKLLHDFPSANWLEQLQREDVELGGENYSFKSRFEGSKLLGQLSAKCIAQIHNDIDSVLCQASSVSRKDAKANLKMTEKLEDKCKRLLKELRLSLGKTDLKYIEYADKVANQILDCCIAYYNNDADNSKRAKNVIKYTRYAYRIAEGKTAKERAKKNLDILNEIIDKSIPESIEEEYNAIDKMVMQYHETNSKVDYSDYLVYLIEEAYQKILSIGAKLGINNKHYIDISSNFVGFVLQVIIKKINSTSKYSTYAGRTTYISTLQWGRNLFNALAKFDKNEECQADYDKNYNALLALLKKNTSAPPKPRVTHSQSSSDPANSRLYAYIPSKPISKEDSSDSEGTPFMYLCCGVVIIALLALFIGLGIDNQDKKPAANTTEHSHINESDATSSPNKYEDDVLADEYSYADYEAQTVSFATGDRPYQSTYGQGNYDNNSQNSLLIRNGSSTDAVVFLERMDGTKIRHVYIEKDDNFTMTKIPGGQYIIKIMQGLCWYPEKDNGTGNPQGGFIKDCSMSQSESYDPFEYPYPSSGRYGRYEVTLYKVQNGNLQTESINANDLF